MLEVEPDDFEVVLDLAQLYQLPESESLLFDFPQPKLFEIVVLLVLPVLPV